ncbi:MAG: MFS transporter [Candidatus Bathyarchaeia archaeon]
MPLIYAFASSVYELIMVEFIIGIIVASSDVALSAYLLDISPRGFLGSYVGLFNALVGIFTFIGSIAGGYCMDFLTTLGFGFQESMLIAYAISIAGRLILGLLYITLKEPYKYPAKIGEEFKKMLKEIFHKI